jgi:hypothetical protein
VRDGKPVFESDCHFKNSGKLILVSYFACRCWNCSRNCGKKNSEPSNNQKRKSRRLSLRKPMPTQRSRQSRKKIAVTNTKISSTIFRLLTMRRQINTRTTRARRRTISSNPWNLSQQVCLKNKNSKSLRKHRIRKNHSKYRLMRTKKLRWPKKLSKKLLRNSSKRCTMATPNLEKCLKNLM